MWSPTTDGGKGPTAASPGGRICQHDRPSTAKSHFCDGFSLDANNPHLRQIKVPDTLMKDSLTQYIY